MGRLSPNVQNAIGTACTRKSTMPPFAVLENNSMVPDMAAKIPARPAYVRQSRKVRSNVRVS
jgi:hypothetical protein